MEFRLPQRVALEILGTDEVSNRYKQMVVYEQIMNPDFLA